MVGPGDARVESEVEHQRHGCGVVGVGLVRDEPSLIASEAGGHARMSRDHGLGGGAVGPGTRGKQPLRRRRVTQQQFDEVVVAEKEGGLDGRDVVVEHPPVDIAATIADFLARRRPLAVVGDGVLALADAMIQRLGVVVQAALDQIRVAQPNRHEDVEPRAALDEQTRHLRCIADEVLRRRRLVIHIACVDVGATVDEVLRDLDRACAVQRGLAVAAACVDERRVLVDQRPASARTSRGAPRQRRRRSLPAR